MQTKLSIFATKVIEAGWLAAVIAVPLFFNIYTARTFEPDKLTLLRSIVTVMVLAWLIKLLEEGVRAGGGSFGERAKAWLKQPMSLAAVLILLVYLLSTALSLAPHVSFWGSYQRLQGTYTFISYVMLFFMIAANMTTREQVNRFVTTVILASVPVALYGIIQHNGLDPLPWAGDVTKRVASNMGNAIFVASYLIMIVPMTVSRLIKSMHAIITEEHASWGHTILAAVYIFIAAIQILTIIYSISRGPQIGLLGGAALMGLLLIMILRQRDKNASSITLKDIGQALGYVVISGVAAGLLGAVGYFIGKGIESALLASNLQLAGASTVAAVIGGAIGFAGAYTLAAATGRGWRWLWLTWVFTGIIGAAGVLAFLIALNNPNSSVSHLAHENEYFSRMAAAINTDSGTGKVRVLIWEGAFNLISPHRPLGVEGEFTDGLNAIRPLIGYGSESMFNAFAFAYPPDLAHVENRGSSADRSHNETMDSLVMNGLLGFAAFYFLMGSLFYFALNWLGWVSSTREKQFLIGLMATGAIGGAVAAYVAKGAPVLVPVGLPFGLFAGVMLYLVLRGFTAPNPSKISSRSLVLIIGLLGAFAGHFLEVHFVFSIAATYTYFWAYLGVMIALWRIETQRSNIESATEPVKEEKETPTPKSRRKRKKSRSRNATPKVAGNRLFTPESWETWLGGSGLVMAIILIVLTFDFVPVQFQWSTGRYSLLWMLSITYLMGVAITLAELAVRKNQWQASINWARAAMLYLVTSLGYAAFYVLVHTQQRHALTSGQLTDALVAAHKLFAILIGFYIALFVLLLVFAGMLSQQRLRGLRGMQTGNWWLYPPMIAAAVLIIGFKNIDVVKADTFLKEGDRYRSAQQWDNATKMHAAAVAADPDEDFYDLMLALDYQLKAQDNRLDAATRQQAWLDGEKIALKAREINIYNPDNTGNMGRYYFTLGQVLDPSYFDKAKSYFEKVIQLAPQNVQYYNLLAQTYYIQNDYDTAIEWLNKSTALDSEFPPTWLQLGDTYAAKSEPEAALEAHTRAIEMNPTSFADANFDSRVSFYVSANMTDKLIAAFNQYLADHSAKNTTQRNRQNQVEWAIGHIYRRTGNITQTIEYMGNAIANGYQNGQALAELADVYLSQQNFVQSESLYQQALKTNSVNPAQILSSLGYIYAQTGRIQEAIDANNQVLQYVPNDYDSHKNLALLYQQQGQLDQAIAHAQSALQVAPEAVKADLQTFIDQLKAAQGQ